MPAFISTIKNVLGIHGIATKSGDFSPNLLENKNLKKKSIACCHRNTVFDAMFGEMLIFFWYLASNTNEVFQTISTS